MSAPVLSLVLPFPPALNHYYRSMGRVLLSREAREYKRAAGYQALVAGAQPLAGPLAVEITLYRPARRGDIDGYFKAAFDSLNGIAWTDDSQVVELHAYRRDDKTYPRAEVRVWPVREAGQEADAPPVAWEEIKG
jgi:Holliday junction resolvase RusA-like endonuclease